MGQTVNADWINTDISNDTIVSTVDDAICNTREAMQERFAKEHTTFEDDSSEGGAGDDGYHLSGSAKAYAQSAAPTMQPDGESGLGDADKGRIWIKETTDTDAADDLRAEFKYYHPTHGWKDPNYFTDKVFFTGGVSIGGVDVTGTGFDGFLGVNDENQIMGFTGDLEIDKDRGIIPTTDGESHLGTSDNSFATIYGDKVYGAVGNDFADEIDGVEDQVMPGRCYVSDGGKVRRSREKGERGTIGLCTDTASIIANNKHIKGEKINIAVAGFALGYVDKRYPIGTPLTSGPKGRVTKASLFLRIFHPERVIGIYFRDSALFWGETPMQGRAIVKVR